jgi:hypothetical protein
MSNLHAPTVPSGPTTARVANGNATQLSIAELQRKKDIIEGELKALGGVLDSVRGPRRRPLWRGGTLLLTPGCSTEST